MVGRYKAETSDRRIVVMVGLHLAAALLLTLPLSLCPPSGLLMLRPEAKIMGGSHNGI